MANINRVLISGNLTRDPELRTAPSGFKICSMRIATNTRRKENDEWVDKANYFDVTVFGRQGENCAQYLSKGRGVFIDGRLEWREWEKDGQKRQAVEIIADTVEFKGAPMGHSGGNTNSGGGDTTAGGADQDFGGGPSAEDDIPF